MQKSKLLKDALGKTLNKTLFIPIYVMVISGLIFVAFFVKTQLDQNESELMIYARDMISNTLSEPSNALIHKLNIIEKSYIQKARVDDYLDEQLLIYPSFQNILIINAEGVVQYTTSEISYKRGFDYSQYKEYQESEINTTHWSQVSSVSQEGNIILRMSYKSEDGNVIIADIASNEIQSIILDLSGNGQRKIAIVGDKGAFIAHTDYTKTTQNMREDRIDEITKGKPGPKIMWYNKKGYIIFYEPIHDQNLYLVTYTILSQQYNDLFVLALGSFIFLSGLTFFVIYYLKNHSQRIIGSIDDLVLITGEMAKGHYGVELAQSYYEEVNMLIDHFNTMSEVIAKSFKKVSDTSKSLENLNKDLLIHNEIIRASEAQIEKIIDNSYDGVILMDGDHNILRSNDAVWELFDVPRVESENRLKCYEIFGVDAKSCNHCSQKVVERTGIKHLRLIELEDKIIEELTVPLYDEKDELSGYIISYRNVTEQKTLEKQVNRATKMEAIGRLTSGIAHDFNNILQVILGYSELLHYQLEKIPDHKEMIQKVNSISDAALKAERLIRKLMTFSKMDQVTKEPMVLNEVVVDISQMLERIIGDNIRLELHLDQSLDVILADKTQVEQIIVNLCVNAKDAIVDEGEIVIKTYETLRKSGHFICLEISDNGSGMSGEVKEKIFEPFFTTKSIGQGTGLGLATVLGIVESHGGTIEVETQLGIGTTFRIIFPNEGTMSLMTGIQLKHNADLDFQGLQLLYVDDDEMLVSVHKHVLENLGIRVWVAKNGSEALATFSHLFESIDLVVLDSIMPEMGGLEVFEHLRAIDRTVKVLLTTGYNDSAVLEAKSVFNQLRLMKKPYGSQDLIKGIIESVYE